MRGIFIFNYLLESTVLGTVLILLLTALRSLLRGKAGSRFLSWMWLLPELRLVLPIALPNPLMDSLRPAMSVDEAARPAAARVRSALSAVGAKLKSAAGGKNPLSALAGFSAGRGLRLMAVWGGAALLILLLFSLRRSLYEKKIRKSRVREFTPQEYALLTELCRKYRVRRLPKAYFSDRVSGGLSLGLFRPCLILPLDTPFLNAMLSRELCRIRLLGRARTILRSLCCALHWFNPFVWLAAWLAYADGEVACDGTAAAGMSPAKKVSYGEMILSSGGKETARVESFTGRLLRMRLTELVRGAKGSRFAVGALSLAGAVLLAFSFATRESLPLPTVEDVPGVSWIASAQPIDTDTEAIACARRFLESDFVHADTSRCAITARTDGRLWQIEANPDGYPVTLTYSRDGYLLSFSGASLLRGAAPVSQSYVHPAATESVKRYLQAFTMALVPGPRYTQVRVTDDARDGRTRVLTLEAQSDSGACCVVRLETSPEIRVIECQTMENSAANG